MTGKPFKLALAIAWLALGANLANAQTEDRVRRVDGRSVRGTIVSLSPTEVTVNQGAGRETAVPVNEIDSVSFTGEPNELSQARLKIASQRFEDALESLQGLDAGSSAKAAIRQDIEFYKALCGARLALAGKAKVADAGRDMYTFVKSHSDSYHYFEAVELLGDLLIVSGAEKNAERAQAYFDEIADKAPWAETKLRATLLSGQALIAQQKHAQAAGRFDTVIAAADDSPESMRLQQLAQIGKGLATALAGNSDSGVQLIGQTLKQANEAESLDSELLSRGYLARALAYLNAGKQKQALWDLLHVHLLYNTQPDSHAAALHHLSQLWTVLGHDDRAREAAKLLKDRYPNSRWASGS